MADESDGSSSGSSTTGTAPPTAIGLALSGASRTKADAFLDEQAELLRLQKEQLREETRLRRWMLRFEHASAGMKVAFEVAVAFIVVTAAAVIGGAVWSAINDNGLVVEAFSVPSDYASRGLTGQVLASHLLDRLSEMRAQTKSTRRAATYTNTWGNDIKVEIPTTGISFNELQRLLNAWLGHETRISGEVFRTVKGIAVAVRVGAAPATTFEGVETDINTLVSRAAEEVYKQTQPFRYAYYLVQRHRVDEAEPIFRQLSATGTSRERAWAYTGWANLIASRLNTFDPQGVLDKANDAIASDPQFPQPYFVRGNAESLLGHVEAAFADLRLGNKLNTENARYYYEPESVGWMLALTRENLEYSLGDYRAALDDDEIILATRGLDSDPFGQVEDLLEDHDVSRALKVLQAIPDSSPSAKVRKDANLAFALVRSEDWAGLAKLIHSSPALRSSQIVIVFSSVLQPGLAYGLARAGDVKEAEALISTTPTDCYGCIRERGDIATVVHDWRSAEHWYAEAVRQAPSIPFAYADWGEMLLHRGDYDGAIAKFEQAHAKGPHFADPLEMWGEVLMQKNRSDLALAKLEEAEKYAPRWGRLHLKWGEALSYLGRKDEAHAQYQSARGMDLSSTDQARLARDAARLGH